MWLMSRFEKGFSVLDNRDNYCNDDIDLYEYLEPLTARWKTLLIVFLVGALGAFVYSRTLPKVYQSTATVFVQQSSSASSLLKSLPINVGGAGGSTSGYLTTVLQSDALVRRVVRQLNLTKDPGMVGREPLNEDQTVELYTKSLSVAENKNGSISIAMKAYNPYLAAKTVNTMLDNLGLFMVTSSKKKTDFISQKLDETNKDLTEAEDRLTTFLEKNNVAAIDEETKGLIQQLGTLEAKQLELDTELQSVSSVLGSAGKMDQLVDSEVQKKSLQASRDYVANKCDELRSKLTNLPAVAAKYARLQRQIMVLSKTYELLTEQYQLANITQKGEDGDYQIVDRARPNLKKVAPRPSVNAILGGFGAFCFAAVIINIRAAAAKRKTRRTPPHSRPTSEKPTDKPAGVSKP